MCRIACGTRSVDILYNASDTSSDTLIAKITDVDLSEHLNIGDVITTHRYPTDFFATASGIKSLRKTIHMITFVRDDAPMYINVDTDNGGTFGFRTHIADEDFSELYFEPHDSLFYGTVVAIIERLHLAPAPSSQENSHGPFSLLPVKVSSFPNLTLIIL